MFTCWLVSLLNSFTLHLGLDWQTTVEKEVCFLLLAVCVYQITSFTCKPVWELCVQPLLIPLVDLTGLNQVSCNLKLYCSLQGNPLYSWPSAVRGQEFGRQGRLQSRTTQPAGLRFCSRTRWKKGQCSCFFSSQNVTSSWSPASMLNE